MRKNAAHAAPERRVALLRLRYPIGEFVPEKFEVLRPELRVHTVGADEDIAAHVAVRHIVNALLLEESGVEAEYVCHIVLHESQAVEKPLLADALMGIFTEPRGVKYSLTLCIIFLRLSFISSGSIIIMQLVVWFDKSSKTSAYNKFFLNFFCIN